jgi:hypothetical protein
MLLVASSAQLRHFLNLLIRTSMYLDYILLAKHHHPLCLQDHLQVEAGHQPSVRAFYEHANANNPPNSVILGSFSNYLVTKSSVPVMVARKKLRKHSKYKRPSVKLANNLLDGVSGRSLSTARVDELIT